MSRWHPSFGLAPLALALVVSIGVVRAAAAPAVDFEEIGRPDLAPVPPGVSPLELTPPPGPKRRCAGDRFANAIINSHLRCEDTNQRFDNPLHALGEPNATGTDVETYRGFVSLGFRGWIAVDMGPDECEWIHDVPDGPDVRIYQYVATEAVEVLAVPVLDGPTYSLGTHACGTPCPDIYRRCCDFDLEGTGLQAARYLIIKDHQGDDRPDSECYETAGADIDAVRTLDPELDATPTVTATPTATETPTETETATPTETATATPTPALGRLSFDRPLYSHFDETADIRLFDPDPADDPNAQNERIVRVWSESGDALGFDMTLRETATGSGYFTTSEAGALLRFSHTVSNREAGLLLVASPDTLRARFEDQAPSATVDAQAVWQYPVVPLASAARLAAAVSLVLAVSQIWRRRSRSFPRHGKRRSVP
ncbi:MAG: hypothetical protein HYV63_22140 [Candidatus Schekmanbacteria bacterium]|nr:hypothetical protein [Candidatus Schekmanbacteria bacterium]